MCIVSMPIIFNVLFSALFWGDGMEGGWNFSVAIKVVMMMMEPHCNKYFSGENKMKIKAMCDCIKIILVSIHILVDSQSQPANEP